MIHCQKRKISNAFTQAALSETFALCLSVKYVYIIFKVETHTSGDFEREKTPKKKGNER